MKYTPSATNDDAMTKESSQEESVHIDYDRDLGHDVPPKAPEPPEAIPRRVYFATQTLEKYGFRHGVPRRHWSQPHRVLPDAAECKEKGPGIRAGTPARESQKIGQRRRRPHGRQTGRTLIAIERHKFFTQCNPCRDGEECRSGCGRLSTRI